MKNEASVHGDFVHHQKKDGIFQTNNTRNENNYVLLRFIIQGKICGNQELCAKRISYHNYLRNWFRKILTKLFGIPESRVKISV